MAGPRIWWLRLGAAAVPLLAAAAVTGVAWPAIYHRDPPAIASQAIGQDWVTLCVAVPALIAGLVAARRGAWLGQVLALGVLGYAAYAYLLYAFGSRHNELFLVYVAAVGAAVWGLVAGLIDATRAAAARPAPARLRWRTTGGFFVVVAAGFALIWLGELVPALVRGETPATVRAWGTPTNGVHVLDLGLVLPVLGWCGARLWRRDPAMVPIAGVLLFKVATLGLAIVAMGIAEAARGTAPDPGLMIAFVVVTAAALGLAASYVRAAVARR